MVIGFGIYAVVMANVATGMEPPSEQEEWFPEDHMYQQFATKQNGAPPPAPTTRAAIVECPPTRRP